ncbi:ion transporter [Candidatus Saccharibacteria bacterium]|nr:ion transporter [Candidatus Saccharibacteria bacterium]
MRRRIFTIIEPYKGSDRLSRFYDRAMVVVIIFSIIPLFFKDDVGFLFVIDKICVAIFIMDYILRWLTADYRFKDKSRRAFIHYPFSAMAIIDLISILPSLTVINNAFKLFRLIRLAKLVRIAKFLRYSRSFKIILGILKKSYHSLLAVGVAGAAYIVIAGLIAFNAEPENFDSIFDAMYWAVIVWNIDPSSVSGHIVAVCSVIFGLAIVALPTSIITAEYVNKLNRAERSDNFKKEIQEINREIEEDIEKDIKKDLEKDLKK